MSIESGNYHEQYANWKAPSSEDRERIKTPDQVAHEATNEWWNVQPGFAEEIKKIEDQMMNLSPDSDDYKKAREQRSFLTSQVLSEYSKLSNAVQTLEASQQDWSRVPHEINIASQNLYNAKRSAESLMSQPDWMFEKNSEYVSVNSLSAEQAKQIETKFGINQIWNSNEPQTLSGFDQRLVRGPKENLMGDSRSQNKVWESLQKNTQSNIVRSREGHLYLPESFVKQN